MSIPLKTLVIGTRNSKLALWQTRCIERLLMAAWPGLTVEIREIITRGDQNRTSPLPEIGGKGLFTAELEEAIRAGEIHIAVHSLKDLPTEMDPFFTLGAIPARGPVRDVLISRNGCSLRELPPAAVVGTSSLRRSSQLRRIRPDLVCTSIRGNVDTRISKVKGNGAQYHGAVLAEAGVERLGARGEISEVLTLEDMLPAPGQGAMAVQCGASNGAVCELLSRIDCLETRAATEAERTFLSRLGAGCSTPVAAYARRDGDRLLFKGRCLSFDGSDLIELTGEGPKGDPRGLGERMAQEANAQGFSRLVLRGELNRLVN